jgi:GDP-fucose transporter C1
MFRFVSISLVFLNKYLLSNEDLKLNAPIFITLTQCVIAVITFFILGSISYVSPDSITFPTPEYNLTLALKMLPLSLLFVSMITFNNLTLKYLGVAFYNVGRSLTTVFNVVFSYVLLKQLISIRVLMCCLCIVAGFLLGIEEEDKVVSNFSSFGVVCGILASASVAGYSIYIKRSLPLVDGNIWRLQIYNNMNAIFLLIPIMICLQEITSLREFAYFDSLMFWGIILTAGVFGIAIGYVMSLQIKVTTPLTHNVSGTAKACFQTILACIVFNENRTWWWWMCNFLVLGGSSAYTYVKMLEMKEDVKSTAPANVEEDKDED